MNRLDRLILRAKPKQTIIEKLREDNPFIGKSLEELMKYMEKDAGPEAPESGTSDHGKFILALMEAFSKFHNSIN